MNYKKYFKSVLLLAFFAMALICIDAFARRGYGYHGRWGGRGWHGGHRRGWGSGLAGFGLGLGLGTIGAVTGYPYRYYDPYYYGAAPYYCSPRDPYCPRSYYYY